MLMSAAQRRDEFTAAAFAPVSLTVPNRPELTRPVGPVPMTYVTSIKAQVLAQDVEKFVVGSNIDLAAPLH